jgi:hypothetical protein
MKKIVALVAWLMFAPFVGAADKPDAEAQARFIAPYLDEQVIAVGHVDLTRLDANALVKRISSFLGSRETGPTSPGAVVRRWLAEIPKAGARDLYIVFPIAERPFVLIPLEGGTDGAALSRLLKGAKQNGHARDERLAMLAFDVSETIGQAVFAGDEAAAKRLRSLKPRPWPGLAATFAAAGDTTGQLLIVPTADMRRVIEELVPQLPREIGDGPSTVLTRGILWAAAGLEFPPQMSLRVVIHSGNARAAESLAQWISATLKIVAQHNELGQQAPGLAQVLGQIKPEVKGNRLILALDDATVTALLKPLTREVDSQVNRGQSINNLRQIVLAFHNYHDGHKGLFPTAASYGKDGEPLLSWRVHILPYLVEGDLYRQFHLDEPWDSAHNKKLIARMPAVYRSGFGAALAGKTSYLGIAGEAAMFPGRKAIGIRDVKDGTSNTILLVEADDDQAVIWTKPDDLTYDPKKPRAGLGGRYSDGFLAAFVDGSVHLLPKDIDPKILNALFTRDGGEVVKLP